MEEQRNADGNPFGESSMPSSPVAFNMTDASNPFGQVVFGNGRNKTLESSHSFDAPRGLIDTAAPFESVKEAVSKFGRIVDWKAQKAVTMERRKSIQDELDKVQEDIPKYQKQSEAAQEAKTHVLEELDSTKRLIDELKLNLEKTETEEAQAKQDSELAQLRVQEMEQGIADDASVAAKAQVQVAKARHEAALDELQFVKNELTALQEDYHRLITERDSAINEAEHAVSASRDAEKKVEDLTLELITTKEALESAHAAHLEAEENRLGVALANDQISLKWEEELKLAQEELQQLNDQLSSAKDLKSKLDVATNLLFTLKAELAAYMQGNLISDHSEITEEGSEITDTSKLASAKKELEEVQNAIAKARDEVNYLKAAASSLKAELDQEAESLTTLRQREGLASATVSSLEAELSRMQSELQLVLSKEREASAKMIELPKLIQQASRDAEQAKSIASSACEELRKAKEEADQAMAGASTMEIRLVAALKEIEAAKASERLALAAIKAMQESEEQRASHANSSELGESEDPLASTRVILSIEEYYKLSKDAHAAEEVASEKVISAIEKIKEAKKSEVENLERLEAAYREMEEKKEALKAAKEKAEKANEGKLGAEQDLREWRAENEKRRASDASASQLAENPSRCNSGNFEFDVEEKKERKSSLNGEASLRINSASDPEVYADISVPDLRNRRKKSFFPRIVMFLARKKAQSLK